VLHETFIFHMTNNFAMLNFNLMKNVLIGLPFDYKP